MSASSGHRRGPYRVGVERRKSIIKQAGETFAQSGFYGGTMRDVAERVGVTPAALARYFSSKEELLVAVMDYHLDQWRAYVDEAAGPGRVGLAYIRGTPKVIEYLEQNPGTARILAGMTVEGSDPSHPAHAFVQRSTRTTRESFSTHVAEAVQLGEIPNFTDDQVHLEAAQIAMAMSGAVTRVAIQTSVPVTVEFPSAADVFAAYIEGTIARWRAMLALQRVMDGDTKA